MEQQPPPRAGPFASVRALGATLLELIGTRGELALVELRGLPSGGVVPAERRFPILLQVNVDGDPGKAGFSPDALRGALPELEAFGALRLDGLMTIGRLGDDPEAARPTFRALRELARRARLDLPGLGRELSMGMSDDFAVAVEEGATLVRVGRALFGERAAHR